MDKSKKKTLTNIIGLEYQQNALGTEELKKLENGLNECGISLKTYANTPKCIMGIESLFPQIQIFLSSDIIQAICLGVVSSAVWEGIKFFLKSLRNIIKKKPLTRVSNDKVDTNVTSNIYLNIEKSHVVIPMDIDDEKFEYFVDKMFESINQDIITEEKYAFYDAEKETLEYYYRHEVVARSYKQWSETKGNKDN